MPTYRLEAPANCRAEGIVEFAIDRFDQGMPFNAVLALFEDMGWTAVPDDAVLALVSCSVPCTIDGGAVVFTFGE